MNSVSFIHRTNGLPSDPVLGSFYWIDDVDGKGPQIWFACGSTSDKMVCLNEKFNDNDLEGRLSEIEIRLNGINERLDGIDERLNEIDLSPYITDEILNGRLEELKNEILEKIDELSGSDFGDFVTGDDVIEMMRDWSPDVELDDSDYEAIAEKVKLTWQII